MSDTDTIKTNYHFFPYLRQGLAASINSDDIKKRAELSVMLSVKKGDLSTELPSKIIELYGPGDIVGFDPNVVIRTNPLNNVGDFESNFFPMVEFSDPDFPWRFTAKAASESDGILPWITLIVLLAEDVADEKKEYEDGERMEDNPVPWIKIFSKDSLPDLTQTWKWAHVQLTTSEDVDSSAFDGEVLAAKKAEPERLISRLLCPRKLRAGSLYHAFIVPTFKLGRLAGRGLDLGDTNACELSWDDASASNIDLPYYYKWEFRTGKRGDFEHLVRLLEPRELEGLGTRKMDCSNPGYNLASPDAELELEGALQALGTEFTPWGKDKREKDDDPVTRDLFGQFFVGDRLNAPRADLTSNSTSTEKPTVAPPIYGRWHVARQEVNYSNNQWIDELNLDPRHRTVAGFGAGVVKKQQEALMASAWDQLGSIEQANELLRRAQLGYGASNTIYNSFSFLSSDNFFQLISPLNSRVRVALDEREISNPPTVYKHFKESRIPLAALDPAFRKIARKRGPIRRRQKNRNGKYGGIFERFNIGDLDVAGKHPAPDGMIGFGDITDMVMRSNISNKYAINFISVPDFVYKNHFKYKIKLKSAIGNIRIEAKKLPKWLALSKLRRSGVQFKAMLEIKKGIKEIPDGKYLIVLQTYFNKSSSIDPNEFYFSQQSFTLTVKRNKFISPDRIFLCSDIIKDEKKIPHTRPFFNEENLSDYMVKNLYCGKDDSLSLRLKDEISKTVGVLYDNQPKKEEKPSPIVLEHVKSLMKEKLSPSKTIVSRIGKKLRLFDIERYSDPLVTIMAAPKFPQPMYEPLRDLSQDLVLPGIEKIPQNTIGLLQPNHRFIESYMCGLNHEFAGELLWREYPTDQRGTYFRQFWDVSEVMPSDEIINQLENRASNDCSNLSEEEKINLLTKYEDKLTKSVEELELDNIEKIAEVTKILFEEYLEEYLKDIKPIHGWNAAKLGDNAIKRGEVAAENQLVLTIRGDLLKKYPGTIIYAVRGIVDDHGNEKPLLREHLEEDFPVNLYDDAKKTDLKTKEIIIETEELDENGNKKYKWSDSLSVNKHVRSDPIFGGSLLPDIKFLGFDITEDQALGKETSPLLGGRYFVIEERVSETCFGLDLTDNDSPANITEWDDLTWQHLGLQDGDYLSAQEPVTLDLIDEEQELKLNDNSPRFAQTTMQKPVRIVMHAKQMIPRSGR